MPERDRPAQPQSEQRPLLNPNQALSLGFALLGFYVLPPVLFLIALIWTKWGQQPSWYFAWFLSLARNNASALTEIHQLLLPLLSGLSIVAFAKHPQRVHSLAFLCLFGFVLAIFLDVALGIPSLRRDLAGSNVDAGALESIVALLRRIRENLLVYFAIVVGIRLGGR